MHYAQSVARRYVYLNSFPLAGGQVEPLLCAAQFKGLPDFMPYLVKKVTVDTRGLRQFRKKLDGALNKDRRIINRWAIIYRTQLHDRFKILSQGGGWAPLKLATIKKRSRVPYRFGLRAILRHMGQLFKALSPIYRSYPGQWQKFHKDGVSIGIAGGAKHMEYRRGKYVRGKHSIGRIAQMHHRGEGNNPRRMIVVEPNQDTLRKMQMATTKTLQQIARETSK